MEKPPYYSPETPSFRQEFTENARRTIRLLSPVSSISVAVFTGLLCLVSCQQEELIKDQLGLSAADERPWLKIEVAISDAVDFTSGSGVIPLSYQVKNVGKLPAMSVYVASWPFLGAPWSDGYFSFQRKMCLDFSKRPKDPLEQTWVIMPGETKKWDGAIGKEIPGYTPDMLRRITQDDPSLGRQARIVFAGCVDYTTPNGSTRHQTAFSFQLDEIVMAQDEKAQSVYVSLTHKIQPLDLLLQEFPAPADMTN